MTTETRQTKPHRFAGAVLQAWQRKVGIAAAVAICAAIQAAAADDYPSRTVRIIVPYGPGGPTDIYGRVLAQDLHDTLKQPFVIENRPGAGTMIGTQAAAQAAPDGYTLLMMSSTHAVNETLVPKKPFVLLRDFVAVAPLVQSDLVLLVNSSVPAHNLHELVALAKAKPGQLNYASSGPGSNYHMAAELLKNLTGIDIVHVPYRDSSGARTGILGGQVQMMFDSVTSAAPIVQSGKVRAIGTTGLVRSDILPDVPTLNESGVPGYEFTQWIGMVAPKGTPQQIVDLLSTEITKTVTRPDVKAQWEKQGATPMTMKPAEFQHFIQGQIDKWAKIIHANKIALVR